MPGKRTDVEKIKEILRLSFDLKLSIRKIAEALEISKTGMHIEHKAGDIFVCRDRISCEN